MYDIMWRGGVPRFRVIERVDNAIASFVSETNWAQRYIAEGAVSPMRTALHRIEPCLEAAQFSSQSIATRPMRPTGGL